MQKKTGNQNIEVEKDFSPYRMSVLNDGTRSHVAYWGKAIWGGRVRASRVTQWP